MTLLVTLGDTAVSLIAGLWFFGALFMAGVVILVVLALTKREP